MEQKTCFDVFDIIGPIMIGPSSSHTAGAVRIGLLAGQLCAYEPRAIRVMFHGSLESTYAFHKTDTAVVAGVMGIGVDDERIREAFDIAKQRGISVKIETISLENAHPSTICIELTAQDGVLQYIRAATIGGGNILIEEINGQKLALDGKMDHTVPRQTAAGETKPLLLKAVQPQLSGEMRFYKSCAALLEKATADYGGSISETVIAYEMQKSGRTREAVFEQMRESYRIMQDSIQKGLEKESKLLGNIFAGNAAKMDRFIKAKRSICGEVFSKVTRAALAVMEINGSMGKVVACPTAGSAGTVPAVIVTMAQEHDICEERMVQAMFTGAGIGIVIAENATISGAVGGCQAECGSASAIAAAILTDVFGGTQQEICSAVSLAFGNVLGMVCDPIAGMVEVPCIQRNAIAAANAILVAEMALSGEDSVIPVDELIGALDEVGKLMSCKLKDTLGAGISNTPTARKIEKTIFAQ